MIVVDRAESLRELTIRLSSITLTEDSFAALRRE
jgi:hypothetical protein